MEENREFYEPVQETADVQTEAAAQQTAESQSAKGNKGFIKKNLIKLIIAAAALVVVVVGLIVGISVATNNYKTPIQTLENYYNVKKYTQAKYLSYLVSTSNGLGNVNGILKYAQKSENFEDNMEDALDNLNDGVDDKVDQYGSNYKISYVITDKEQLEKKDLRTYRDNLRDTIESLSEFCDETEDYESSDWADLADELGLTKSDAKAFIKQLKAHCDKLEHLDVTDGYELSVTITTTGKELDEPIENDTTFIVLKVNGRWIETASFQYWYYALYLMG